MAKPKTTTTTTKSSSSKTKEKKHTGDGRSSKSRAVTSASPVQSPLPKRKAKDGTGGSHVSKRRRVVDNNVSNISSQNVTPGSSIGKGKQVALPETEIFRQRHASVFGDVVLKVEEPDTAGVSACAPSAVESNEQESEQEKVLDGILIGGFGSEARRHAVDQLIEAARWSAASETDYGVTYVEATISRLKRKGIDEPRLVEVVAMLQEGLWQPFLQFRARVDSLGGSLPSPVCLLPGAEPVAVVTSTATDLNGLSDHLQLRSSQSLSANFPLGGKGKSARSEPPSESADSSSDDETVTPGSQKNSRYRDDDDDEYVDSSSYTAQHHEQVEQEDGPANGSTTNYRLYGTRQCNGRPFDIYVRSAISACMPPPGDDLTAMRIRGEAYRLWRRVSKKDKESWKDLYKTRHSDPKELLAKLRVHCQHIFKTADAGPSRPLPALPQSATTVQISSGDVAGVARGTSHRPHSPPALHLSGNVSEAYPASKDDTITLDASERSYSPPEFILSEHASVAQPVPADAATTSGASDRASPCSTSAASEHMPSAHFNSSDEASTPSTSDRFSSSPEPTSAEHLSEEHWSSQGTAGASSALDRQSSPPAPAVTEHRSFANPVAKNIVRSKDKIEMVFPCLSHATSITPREKACYVPFAPRRGKEPSRLFIVNTPDVPTRNNITKKELQKACSASGLPRAHLRHRNAITVSFPNKFEAASVQHSVSVTLPSVNGQTVDVKASYHGPHPSRVFSCDARYLDINHASVGDCVLRALRGSVGGPRAPFELLRQKTSDLKDDRRRYLLRFDFAFRPPCTPWIQCFYVPLDHSGNKRAKVWGVFVPEDVLGPCPFCGERCQRSPINRCPFTKIVGKR